MNGETPAKETPTQKRSRLLKLQREYVDLQPKLAEFEAQLDGALKELLKFYKRAFAVPIHSRVKEWDSVREKMSAARRL